MAEIDHATANSGAEALAYLQTEPVAVLVTDLTMPGINGLELFTRAKHQHPMLRGILFSGHITYEVVLQILELGFDDALTKPLKDFQVLTNAIRDSLDLYETWRLRVIQLRGFSKASAR